MLVIHDSFITSMITTLSIPVLHGTRLLKVIVLRFLVIYKWKTDTHLTGIVSILNVNVWVLEVVQSFVFILTLKCLLQFLDGTEENMELLLPQL